MHSFSKFRSWRLPVPAFPWVSPLISATRAWCCAQFGSIGRIRTEPGSRVWSRSRSHRFSRQGRAGRPATPWQSGWRTRPGWRSTSNPGRVTRSVVGDSNAYTVEIVDFAVAPGKYRFEVAVEDSVSGRKLSSATDLQALSDSSVASDLLIAPEMRLATANDTVPRPGEFRTGNNLVTATARVLLTPFAGHRVLPAGGLRRAGRRRHPGGGHQGLGGKKHHEDPASRGEGHGGRKRVEGPARSHRACLPATTSWLPTSTWADEPLSGRPTSAWRA